MKNKESTIKEQKQIQIQRTLTQHIPENVYRIYNIINNKPRTRKIN